MKGPTWCYVAKNSKRKDKCESLVYSRELLYLILDPKMEGKIPQSVIDMAQTCIEHFPWPSDMAVKDDSSYKYIPLYKKDNITRIGW